MKLTVLELCAGGGGQALGLEMAGFAHAAAVEIEPNFCVTLRTNRPSWNVLQMDIRHLQGEAFRGVDLLAAGVPCPPFSIAGKQLGENDERDMFPSAIELVEKIRPRAVLFENVQGFASAKFADYRKKLMRQLSALDYIPAWKIIQAADFGVPQLRPRFVLVALKLKDFEYFAWPKPQQEKATVGESLLDLMEAKNWPGASRWAKRADHIAPTIVGGSKKHGGPDLGPTRAKRQWREMGVDAMGIADDAPAIDFPLDHSPRLTLRMVARLQSFPDEWKFAGPKTTAYRQVGNAFPPLVARAVGLAIQRAIAQKPKHINGHQFERQMALLEDPLSLKKIWRLKKAQKS